MSVEIISVPFIHESPVTQSLATDSSISSDSDHGYVTPVENFADDEHCVEEVVRKRSPIADKRGLVIVEPELKEKIIKQVEWYFSDENLLKDSFLMKHINRNKLGYVSLKLVASLRKVKALTKDWQVVLQCVKESTILAVHEEGTKLRRLQEAPQVDYTHVDRTILVTDYPSNEPTIQEIEQHFSKHGEVALVRILHPGRAIPLDVKPCRLEHPELGKVMCILVEFESKEETKRAWKKYLSQQSWRNEIKVHLLGSKATKSKSDKVSIEQEAKTSPKPTETKRKLRKQANNDTPKTTITRWGKDEPKNDNTLPTRYSRESREGSPSKLTSWRSSSPPTSNNRLQQSKDRGVARKFLHPDTTSYDYASDSGYSRASSESPKNSPEPTKRFFSRDAPSWRKNVKHATLRDSVIREPLGPDGSKGFRPRRAPIDISIIQAC